MMKEKCSTEIEEEELKNNLEIESINNENKKKMELKRIKYEEQLLLKQNNIENMRNEMMLQMLANQIFILNNQNYLILLYFNFINYLNNIKFF